MEYPGAWHSPAAGEVRPDQVSHKAPDSVKAQEQIKTLSEQNPHI